MTSLHPNLLILNLPPKTFVGIDLASFNSSPKFHGITNLPVGQHLLYTGTDASLAIRHGHWISISLKPNNPQVYVFQWNHNHESLELLESSDAVAVAATNSIPALKYQGLVDYTALNTASSNLRASQSGSSQVAPRSKDDGNDGNDHEDDDSGNDTWTSLTSHITPTTLTRILSSQPAAAVAAASARITATERGNQSSSTRHHPRTWTLSSIASAPQDTERIPGLTTDEASSVLQDEESSPLNFIPINLKQTWPEDSFGRDRTEKARDKSWYLNHLVDQLSSSSSSTGLPGGSGPPTTSEEVNNAAVGTDTAGGTAAVTKNKQIGARELLAELQLAFIAVLTLANYSAFEQWKRILSVILGCKAAIAEVEPYFVEVVKVLRGQLGRVDDVEGGLFEMGDEMGSSWLRGLLASFRGNVDELLDTEMGIQEEGELKRELTSLENWLRDVYGWEDRGNILKKGMMDLEDGERIELQVDGADEEEETGEYAPVVVEM